MSTKLNILVSKLSRRTHWRPISATFLGFAMFAILFSPGTIAPFTMGEVQVTTGTGNFEFGAQAATGPDGEIYVAYWDLTGMAGDLKLAVDSNGVWPEGRPVFATPHTTVNDGGSNVLLSSFWTATLAVAPNGDIYAAWRDNRDSATTGSDIRLARSTNGGSSFGPSVKVSDFTTANSEQYPSLAIAPNGDIWAAWGDNRDGDYDVFVAYSTDQGASWSTNIKVNDDATNSQYYPRMAFDSLGTLFIVWTDWRFGPAKAYMDYTSDDGATWAGNFRIPELDVMSGVPDIAVDVNDVVHVTWQDVSVGGGVWYRHSFDHGMTFSTAVRLDNGRDQYDPLPRFALSDSGEIYITWHDEVGATAYPRYAYSPNFGTTWYDEYTITYDGGFRPTAAIDDDRNVIWAYSRNEGVPNYDEVYMIFTDRDPSAPQNLTATDLPTPGSVRLEWDPNPERDINGYEVVAIVSGFMWERVATLPPTQTSYDLVGLENGEYTYAVVAYDVLGQNSEGAFVTFTVGPTLQDLINILQNDVNSLQTQLSNLETNMQNEIDDLQNQLDTLEDDLEDVQTQNNELRDQLDSTKSDLVNANNLNMILIIIVIVLIIVTMILAARKPKTKEPTLAPPPSVPETPPQQPPQPPE